MMSTGRSRRLKAAWLSAWRHVTVEPVIFLYLVSTGLNQVTRPNLLLQKACASKLNYPQDFCDDVIYNSANETAMDQLQKARSSTITGLIFYMPARPKFTLGISCHKVLNLLTMRSVAEDDFWISGPLKHSSALCVSNVTD